jgi:hypothetical protein
VAVVGGVLLAAAAFGGAWAQSGRSGSEIRVLMDIRVVETTADLRREMTIEADPVARIAARGYSPSAGRLAVPLDPRLSLTPGPVGVRVLNAPKIVTVAGEPVRVDTETSTVRRVVGAQGPVQRVQRSTLAMRVTPRTHCDGEVALRIDVARGESHEERARVGVVVHDGQTFVLGGLPSAYRGGRDAADSIPIASRIFGNRPDEPTGELLVFITPHVVDPDDCR